MRIPKRLQPLIDEGLIDEVVRPITSGKEAEVFVVWASGALRAAKVYKEATNRTFKNRADYLDGRKTRGSRDERALKRGGKFAKDQQEETWQTTELLALHKLKAAGVRVPEARAFMDGVLIMDLVLTLEGEPAPRLADCQFSVDEARALYFELVHEVQRMLCVGIVHGDLSEYNVLMAPYGPVIIDFPQVVDAAASRGARALLLRDVGNLRTFAGRFAPELMGTRFAEEMWALYERALLTPDTELTGQWRDTTRVANVAGVREAIADAERDHERQSGRAPRSSGGPPPRGSSAGPARGANAGASRGSNAGAARGPVAGAERAPEEDPPGAPSAARGHEREPTRGREQEPARAPNAGPPRGHEQGPPRGPNPGPPRGHEQGPPRGPNPGPPRGHEQGRPRGHEQGPPRGPNPGPPRGPNPGPPRGPNPGPPRGANPGPPRGPRPERDPQPRDSTPPRPQSPRPAQSPPPSQPNQSRPRR